MSFSFDKFLRPITGTDRNLKIYEDSGKVRYIINPFHIRHLNVSNNVLKMSLESDRNISISFSTNNEAKIALSKLQSDIDLLQQKVPFMIDKDILNYVTANIQIGPTGSAGTSGTSGISKIYTGTSSTFLTIPASPTQSGSGEILTLQTQTGLGFVPGQTIVVYKDFPTNYLLEDYFVEDGPVYMIGDIDTYSYETGSLTFIPYVCVPVGATSSFWYINLTGQVGEAGTSGTSGMSGQSAYELWLISNPGQTEQQFLDSLVGAQGPKGSPGDNGLPGEAGTSGTSGTEGTSGTSGTSGISGTSGTSGITPSTDLSLSGYLTVSGLTTLNTISEKVSTIPGATSSVVVYDASSSLIWYHGTASSNYTANFINFPTTDERVTTANIIISQGSTGYSPTSVQIDGSPYSIKWANGTYSVSSNKVDVVGFTFIRTGATWSQVLGQISSFS